MRRFLAATLAVMLAASALPAAYAHTTVSVAQYDIEVGWEVEPPIVGIRNSFVIYVSERGDSAGVSSGITNAFQDLDATAVFGGAEKSLDVNSAQRAGHYFVPIIPTKTGSYSMDISGTLSGVDVDISVPIEDVEPTAVLDFPRGVGSGSQDIDSIKAQIRGIQSDMQQMGGGGGHGAADSGASYDFAVFGMAMGAAGVVLAVAAMLRPLKLRR